MFKLQLHVLARGTNYNAIISMMKVGPLYNTMPFFAIIRSIYKKGPIILLYSFFICFMLAKHPLSSLCEMFLKNSNLTCAIPPLLLVKTQLQTWIEKTFPAIVALCFVLLHIKIDTLLIWHSLMWCSKYFYNNSNRSITIMVAVSVINYFSK